LYNNATQKGPGEKFNNFVILTMPSDGHLEKVHHRMPVFLNEKSREAWLDPNCSFQKCIEEIKLTNVIGSLDCIKVSN
jgi:putative SOS response-associated peptidase YedK